MITNNIDVDSIRVAVLQKLCIHKDALSVDLARLNDDTTLHKLYCKDCGLILFGYEEAV